MFIITKKQDEAINKIIADLPMDYQRIYREIGEYAISLGYLPLLKGAQGQYVLFSKKFSKKTNRTILKIVADFKHPPPYMEMRFFANKPLSPFFEQAIAERLSCNFGSDRLTCINCGNCDGSHSYNYKLKNGENGFLCGFTSLICLPPINVENVVEIKEAMKKQDDFYIKWSNL